MADRKGGWSGGWAGRPSGWWAGRQSGGWAGGQTADSRRGWASSGADGGYGWTPSAAASSGADGGYGWTPSAADDGNSAGGWGSPPSQQGWSAPSSWQYSQDPTWRRHAWDRQQGDWAESAAAQPDGPPGADGAPEEATAEDAPSGADGGSRDPVAKGPGPHLDLNVAVAKPKPSR